jgi:hypothetical protein
LFSDSFDSFTRLASLSFEAINPAKSQSSRSSSLFQAGKTLMFSWAAFLAGLNRISTVGLFPLFRQTEIDFRAIIDLLEIVNASIGSDQFKTDAAANIILDLYRSVTQLKEQTLEQFDSNCVDFDVTLPIRQITTLTHALFGRSILPYFRQAAELSSARIQILAKCSAIVASVESAKVFEALLAAATKHSVMLNRELSALHTQLHLPFSVEVLVVEPETSSDATQS